ADRMDRATELFGLRPEQVEAVLGYYAEFTDEADADIKANALAAAEAEQHWRRGQELLGS
ncbi:MAG: hypothetical protein QOJ92_3042, partial [Frankiales bacterium]|nr:hypothetical protein [Frankiales bacterium]